MKYLTIIFILLISINASAQPGGRGGLGIGSIQDTLKQNIFPIRLTAFNLNDTSFNTTSIVPGYLSTTEEYNDVGIRVVTRHTFYTKSEALWGGVSLGGMYEDTSLNKRLLITNNTDTMIIDVIDIIPPNGVGIRARIDTLIFEPGYYQLNCTCVVEHAYYKVRLSALPKNPPAFIYNLGGGRVRGKTCVRFIKPKEYSYLLKTTANKRAKKSGVKIVN